MGRPAPCRACPARRDSPAMELEAGQMVDEILRELAAAETVEPTVSAATFASTLEAALTRRRQPEGRLGHGVAVGPAGAAVGMAFDRVHLVGVTERGFPAPLPPD